MSAAIEIIQEKVSDYELFTRFNTYYIQSRIALIESDIEDMYDRTTPSYVVILYQKVFTMRVIPLKI